MVIFIHQLVDKCDTNAQGATVQAAIRASIINKDVVTLDFSGIPNVTTSFVNTAFVEIIDDFNFDVFKKYVSIVNVSRQISDLIRSRMIAEAKRAAIAA